MNELTMATDEMQRPAHTGNSDDGMVGGIRSGRLTAVELCERDPSGTICWTCRCDCGRLVRVRRHLILGNKQQSCGCISREKLARRQTRHGHASNKTTTPEYRSWLGIITRCENKSTKCYPYYGGRGIGVCERWRRSFQDFLSDMGQRPPGMTIDRIDTNGNYEPANCAWASHKQQVRNRTNTVMIEHGGVRRPAQEWAEVLGISGKVIRDRIRRGWPAERALTPRSFNVSRKPGANLSPCASESAPPLRSTDWTGSTSFKKPGRERERGKRGNAPTQRAQRPSQCIHDTFER